HLLVGCKSISRMMSWSKMSFFKSSNGMRYQSAAYCTLLHFDADMSWTQLSIDTMDANGSPGSDHRSSCSNTSTDSRMWTLTMPMQKKASKTDCRSVSSMWISAIRLLRA